MELAPLKIGIACFPLIGGSGILATALGSELARRGHEVYFFSYAQPAFISIESKSCTTICFRAPTTLCRSQ